MLGWLKDRVEKGVPRKASPTAISRLLKSLNDDQKLIETEVYFGSSIWSLPITDRENMRPASEILSGPKIQNKDNHKEQFMIWLQAECIRIFGAEYAHDTVDRILNIFTVHRSNETALQDALCQLLGFEGDRFLFLQELMTRFPRDITLDDLALLNAPPPLPVSSEKPKAPRIDQGPPHLIGTSVSVKKKKNVHPGEDADFQSFDGKYLKQRRAQQLAENASRPLIANPLPYDLVKRAVKYPHVYGKSLESSETQISVYGEPLGVPIGTSRKDAEDYEQISFPFPTETGEPPTEKSPYQYLQNQDDLIDIQELPVWMRQLFPGYQKLNRIQSKVCPTLMETRENILVSAPTGAGKTDIAMLSMLATIRNFLVSPETDKGHVRVNKNFKMVYIAPMKALATEIVRKMEQRLGILGLKVLECTGDTQPSVKQLRDAQFLVATPEKWDVITRKGGENEVVRQVQLLILDEVHLLHDERGAVLESLVARTLRLAERNQTMIRLIGLSATLPNYVDVAEFLRVNAFKGMFVFDESYRPVPLGKTLIGVKGGKSTSTIVRQRMNNILYDKIVPILVEKRQAMVFVHARKETVNTAFAIYELAQEHAQSEIFQLDPDIVSTQKYQRLAQDVERSRNKDLKDLFKKGMGIHNAGMIRSDRLLTEKLFEAGYIQILVCTSTLAWGVNLPAYAVFIKGTEVYDSHLGSFTDLSILDVLQIFGRAGRPQYEPYGLATIITTYDRLAHYTRSLGSRLPIESRFLSSLVDNMNAEVSATETITNIDEAIQWLGMKKNPQVYGLQHWDPEVDRELVSHRRELCIECARTLAKNGMISFDENTGALAPKRLGRIAASYYLKHESVNVFSQKLNAFCTEADVLSVLSSSEEFEDIQQREQESRELKQLLDQGACPCEIKKGGEKAAEKVNILTQAYISRASLIEFSLISDMWYIAQNAPRILRSMLEIAQKNYWSDTMMSILSLCKAMERRVWPFEHPFRQFLSSFDSGIKSDQKHGGVPGLNLTGIFQVETWDVEKTDPYVLRDMNVDELNDLTRNNTRLGHALLHCCQFFPFYHGIIELRPLTHRLLLLSIKLTRKFEWSQRWHGEREHFLLWVEDIDDGDQSRGDYGQMLAVLSWTNQASTDSDTISFIISVSDKTSSLCIHLISDRWVGVHQTFETSILEVNMLDPKNFEGENVENLYSQVSDKPPLPLSTVGDALLEMIFGERLQYFNPVQSQVFKPLFSLTDDLILCCPESLDLESCVDLTVAGAIRRKKDDAQKLKIVVLVASDKIASAYYERWCNPIGNLLGLKLSTLADAVPTFQNANVIITTPAHWVKHSLWTRIVADCMIVDNFHSLGVDLELAISQELKRKMSTRTRLVLFSIASIAPASVQSIGDWLGIKEARRFHFKPTISPLLPQLTVQSVSGRHSRYQLSQFISQSYRLIKDQHRTVNSSVLVMVPTIQQVVLIAREWMSMNIMCQTFLDDGTGVFESITDSQLKQCLVFGIGIVHENMSPADRRAVLDLYRFQHIRLLISTFSLLWDLHSGVGRISNLLLIQGVQTLVPSSVSEQLMHSGHRKISYDTLRDNMSGLWEMTRLCLSNIHVFVQEDQTQLYQYFAQHGFPLESSLTTATLSKYEKDLTGYTYFEFRQKLNPSFYKRIQ